MAARDKKTNEAVLRRVQQWADAERRGDVEALDAILAPEFVGVGPFGFTLDREQWLGRFRSGDYVSNGLAFDEISLRLFGATALVIGRQLSEATYQGRPTGGRFRTTLVFVRRDGDWRLAGLQYSAIPDAPPVSAVRT
jgi:ketosteroid isomerase-like protein